MLGDAFFISTSVTKHTVTLGDGSEHTLYFRRASSYDMQRFGAYYHSKSPDERAEAAHILVAASLCEADGKAALTVEKARTLKPEALDPLFRVALEVNKREDIAGNA